MTDQRGKATEAIKDALRRIAQLGALHNIDVDALWKAQKEAEQCEGSGGQSHACSS